MLPAPKRQKTINGLIKMDMSVRGIAKVLAWSKQIGLDTSTPEKVIKQVDKNFGDFVSTSTPYGNMIQHYECPWGGTLACWNPSAALWYISKITPELGDFLKGLKKEKGIDRFTIIIYEDGIGVGNVLRPDKGRALDVVYWSLKEFPDWLRSSAAGWFPLMFVPEKDLQKHKVHKSWPLEFALDKLFGQGDAPNLARLGVLCKCSNGEQVHIQAKDTVLLLNDEIAMAGQLSLKGCQGKKPCIKCKNIMGRIGVEELVGDPYLKHVLTAKPQEFDLHTDNSIYQMVDVLKAGKEISLSKQQFKKFEMAYGLTYGGFIFSDLARRHLRPATGTMYDWMHCFISSGGIAQYHLNQYVLACKNEGFGVSEVSDFVQKEVQFPTASKKPPCIASRMREDHLHTFAGETLSILAGLALWNDVKLKPSGKLPMHSECLDKLVRVIDLLKMGDKVAKKLPDLKLAIREYISLYTELYPDCCTPKGVHFPYHMPQQIEDHGVNLSTFAPERAHKAAKRQANHMFNKGYNNSAFTKRVHSFCLDWMEPHVLEPFHLLNPKVAPECVATLLAPYTNHEVMLAKKCHTASGMYQSNVFALMSLGGDDAQVQLARPIVFLSCEPKLMVIAEFFHKIATDIWTLQNPVVALAMAEDLLVQPPFVMQQHHLVKVLVPKWL